MTKLGSSDKTEFTLVIFPAIGRYTSEAAFTDSTAATEAPALNSAPSKKKDKANEKVKH